MALVSCGECNKEISSEARRCPSCGKPGQNQIVNWPALVRDTALVWVLTLFGGFVVGVAKPQEDNLLLAAGVSNLLFGGVAFTLSGCLVRKNRFRHLAHLAAATWITSLVNVALGFCDIPTWFLSFLFCLVLMLIGLGLSSAIMNTTRSSFSVPPLPQTPRSSTQEKPDLTMAHAATGPPPSTSVPAVVESSG